MGYVQKPLGPGRRRRRPAASASVAVRRHELGKYHSDHGAEEGERGADDGNVAFGCGPVGGADIAVWSVLLDDDDDDDDDCIGEGGAYRMCQYS